MTTATRIQATGIVIILCMLAGACGSCERPAAPTSSRRLAPASRLRSRPALSSLHQSADSSAALSDETDKADSGDCTVVADANPDYGPPPLDVALSAQANCSEGHPTYKWDFGDGSRPSRAANPTHTYTKPGDYTAAVTITGPDGASASDQVDVTIRAGADAPY